MLSYTKKIFLLLLLICPMTFIGQVKSVFPGNSKKTYKPTTFRPIERVRYDSGHSYPYFIGNFGPAFLNADNARLDWGYEGKFGIGYQITNMIGIECNFGYVSLDGVYYQLEIEKLNALEASFNVNINLTDILFGYNPERRINVEPHIGIGQAQYKAHIIYNNGEHNYAGYDNHAPNNLHGHGVHGRRIALTVPFGINVNYEITNRIKIHLDVETTFTDCDKFDAAELGIHYDWFSGTNLGISYSWGRNGGHKSKFSPCEFTF